MKELLETIFWLVLSFTAVHYTVTQLRVPEPWRIAVALVFAVLFVIYVKPVW